MKRTNILAAFSKHAGRGSGSMYSVAAARTITQDLGRILAPDMPAKVRYEAIYRRLVDVLPDISLRRVRALHNGEVRRVDYEEMCALEETRTIEEERREHRQYLARTNRIIADLVASGSSLSGADMALLARVTGRSADLAGDPDQAAGAAGRGMAGSRTGGASR
jgi:hypothetical protein